ncbi:uncharacterized protein BYT42DRAFT_610642 [Radiomyces spectabilis]|uniref:uncharacterized protein n=1 Tax=Radiomyces spectabilis TaxID=64574 RepID=UPI00222049E2|nr:uncharacterized protein BYT42DRAFT_610642 [Radiomyces spectabilis]KAI8391408.1 hypothetical protein BYT42DRAFT_610642 [Radiomyces spectabilis]
MSVLQAFNDITAAVVQPAGPFAAESPAVFMLRQDDIARSLRNKKRGLTLLLALSSFASIIPVIVLVATTPPRRIKPSIRCGCQARISVWNGEALIPISIGYMHVYNAIQRLLKNSHLHDHVNESLRLWQAFMSNMADRVYGDWQRCHISVDGYGYFIDVSCAEVTPLAEGRPRHLRTGYHDGQ